MTSFTLCTHLRKNDDSLAASYLDENKTRQKCDMLNA